MSGSAGWTDSHCHLQDDYLPEGAELAAVLERAAQAGVNRALCIGTSASSSRAALELAARSSGKVALWASVGLHPHEAEQPLAEIAALAQAHAGGERPVAPGGLVAIGECGLDYFYEHAPRAAQRRVFAAQVELARRLDLVVVVHTRDAWEDTFAVLNSAAPGPTVIHCFTGGPAEAERFLELGAYLSFSGIATFKNAEAVRDAARCCPSDRLLVETDAPFLAPVPHRGRPNEPAFVRVVGEALAALRNVAPEELAACSSANAARLFRLPPPG